VPFSGTYLLNYLHASEELGQASEPFPLLTICENENMLALISISSYRRLLGDRLIVGDPVA
jgi:hypothetical protein